MIGENGYKVECLETGAVSKKTWKTCRGAAKNITKPTQWVTTPEAIEWGLRHPKEKQEIIQLRLKNLSLK